MPDIVPGDSVRTTKQLYFLDAVHPDTGDIIEVRLPRWHRLTVAGVNPEENTIDVCLPGGYIATIDGDDLEV